MASQGLSRKRPAPGTSPTSYQNSYPPPPSGLANYGGFDSHVSDDQFLQFGYQPQIENPRVPYSDNSNLQQSNHNSEARGGSNQLARITAHQVVSRERARGDSSDVQRKERADTQRLEGSWSNDLGQLRQKAQLAKSEAQAKRKQIPPFIQKLAR